jgi:5'-nucleotidase
MKILLSNDDGIAASGLWALHDALATHAEVCVVAPEREQSASSHALTLHQPLRVRTLREKVFAIDGTPTDCVLMAVQGIGGLLDFRPDLVVSGINHGPNLGDDVTYSGTVAAAFEGHLLGFPAIAFSASENTIDMTHPARAALDLIRQLDPKRLQKGLLLNVNFPSREYDRMEGFRITRLGKRVYENVLLERRDPRGRPYFWIGGSPAWEPDEMSDHAAVRDGWISVTPLHLELTQKQRVEEMGTWDLRFSSGGSGE